MRETRPVTDYLRGAAILAVVINHFVNRCVADGLRGYGNGMISLFFVLSGYGLFCSLTALDKRGTSFFHVIVTFWRKRVLRIYPLFWIHCILVNEAPLTWAQFLAVDFINPGVPWFVPAILQCYILAPVLFLLLKRLGPYCYIAVIGAGYLLLYAVLSAFDVTLGKCCTYHGGYFSQVALFAAGMTVGSVSSRSPRAVSPRYAYLSMFLFLVLVQETTSQAFTRFPGAQHFLGGLFLVFSVATVFSHLNSPVRLPCARVLRPLGVYSYSIYLFHGWAIRMLEAAGILSGRRSPLTGILAALALLPLFIAGMSLLEETVNSFARGIFHPREIGRNWLARISGRARRSEPPKT